ncbi:hypothetical protein RHSIM_Rhsim13G0183600 [Rhododendron simsii]|uniref:Ionotropic glutamate receptor C-terminal domain-containing protein n=1 Tax=Rhododendron simsii TaxID=118357 RepID=A0A834FZ25_RHOSS|nr:hypothetical protein RHSIM_Rhsim13G0183600 [Rhododendron simsii]
MPFLRSSTKPIVLFIPILLVSFPVILSQVSVVEGVSTKHETDKLIIGVPGSASFENFVKITPSSENPNEKNYTGFCIRVFEEVRKRLEYPLTYEFVEFNGAYNDLVANVANKNYASEIVKVHKLAKQLRYKKMKVYFNCAGEKITSNYARIVVVVWLFLALVLTQSYTASLTSMLTISRLRPKLLSHSKVGCDENSFMKKYVEEVLKYKNVRLISDGDAYVREFEVGNISAAFLEIPYAKVFVNRYCRKFSIIGTTYRFGGFGFVFQKGSSLTADVSKAILQLSEDGTLKRLEEQWLTPNQECLESETTTENIDSLSLRSFWGLFLFAAGTSFICFLLFLGHLLRDYCHHQSSQMADVNASNESVSIKTVRVARYLMNAEIGSPWRSPSSDRAVPETEMC